MTDTDYERIGREWAEKRGIKLQRNEDVDEDLGEECTWSFSNLPMWLDFELTWIDRHGRKCESSPEDAHYSESDAYSVLGRAINHLREYVQ